MYTLKQKDPRGYNYQYEMVKMEQDVPVFLINRIGYNEKFLIGFLENITKRGWTIVAYSLAPQPVKIFLPRGEYHQMTAEEVVLEKAKQERGKRGL